MKFIHIADLHASKDRLGKSLEVLGAVEEAASSVDFVVFAGDFFDSLITNTENSGFSPLVSAVKKIAERTKVYMVYGTPTHEPRGCLDIFRHLGCEVFKDKSVVKTDKYELVMLPEPRRADYKDDTEALESYADFIEKAGKEPKTLPRVCVFHGEVKGAKYQNGQPASSKAALPKDLLKKLDCDYYAFGHIHKPQEVFPNAFYAGSAIPLNYGETHDGHYNLVEIDGGTKVDAVSFKTTRFVTMYYDEYVALENKWLGSNYRVRIKFKGTEAECKDFSSRFESGTQSKIKSRTGAEEVRLFLEPEEENNARSAEIREMATLSDKLKEYAKVSALDIPEGAEDILEDIQVSELVKEPVPIHSFELVSVRVLGAKGIKDGCGKDEVFVDFSKYEDPLIAIVGENGRGKTSFLENCTPYPFLLTRSGPLKDHFYMNPSARETIWRDENGLYYRLHMKFCSGLSREKPSYMAYTSKDGNDWTPAIGVDGTLGAFTKYVNSTFGPVDLYMRTAFQAKEKSDRVPDIAEATKGERIELFSALAGIGQMGAVSVAARERAKAVENGMKEAKAQVNALRDSADTELLEARLIKARRDLTAAETALEKIEAKHEELVAKDAEWKAAKQERTLKEKMSNDLKRRITKNGIEAGKKEAELKKVNDYFKNIKSVKIYRESVLKFEAARDAHSKAVGALNAKYITNNKLMADISEKEKPLNETERTIGMLNTKIASLEEMELEVGDKCPVCGAALDEHKKSELLVHNFEAKRGIDALKTNLKAAKAKKTKLEKALLELKAEQTELSKKIIDDEVKVEKLREEKQLAEMQMKGMERFKPEKEYAESDKSELEASIKDIEKETKELEKELSEIVIPKETEDVSAKLKQAKEKLSEAKVEATDKKAELKSLEAMKKNAEGLSKKIKALEKEIKAGEKKALACRFLETAFGQKGIPALELENTAPDITRTTNAILSEVFDGRLSIDIAPLRQGVEKQIVDFTIVVKDSKSKWEKSLDLVSSGERVWIKQALCGAFAIILSRQTGLCYKVRFIDEADGTLFAEQRGEFVKLLRKVSELSGGTKTVLITQSQEVKDCIEQQIVF